MGLIDQLPNVESQKVGWPWTEETATSQYQINRTYPKITIVTPSFNQGEFIEETIRSVLLQNYPNLEYFVIDGGSTDDSVARIEKYDQWITYWISEKDRGQTHAINKGFKRATGEIINWVNSDDLLTPNALWQLADFMAENPSVDFVNAGMYQMTQTGTHLVQRTEPFDPLQYFYEFCYQQPSCFFKTKVFETVGYLDEQFEMTMDRDLYVRIAMNFQLIEWEVCLSMFRKHEAQKTHSFNSVWHQNRLIVFSRLIRTLEVETSWIEGLKNAKLYLEGAEKYPTNRSFTRQETETIVGQFLLDLAQRNYGVQQFQICYEVLHWLKKFLPKQFTGTVKTLYRRSKLFRFKPLYKAKEKFKSFLE